MVQNRDFQNLHSQFWRERGDPSIETAYALGSIQNQLSRRIYNKWKGHFVIVKLIKPTHVRKRVELDKCIRAENVTFWFDCLEITEIKWQRGCPSKFFSGCVDLLGEVCQLFSNYAKRFIGLHRILLYKRVKLSLLSLIGMLNSSRSDPNFWCSQVLSSSLMRKNYLSC